MKNNLQEVQLQDFVNTITFADLPENENYRGIIERWAVLNHLGNICEYSGSTLEESEPEYFEEFINLSRSLPNEVLEQLMELNPVYIAKEIQTVVERITTDPENLASDEDVAAAKFFLVMETIGGTPTGKFWSILAEDQEAFMKDKVADGIRGQQFGLMPATGKLKLKRTLTDLKLIARSQGMDVKHKSYLKGYK